MIFAFKLQNFTLEKNVLFKKPLKIKKAKTQMLENRVFFGYFVSNSPEIQKKYLKISQFFLYIFGQILPFGKNVPFISNFYFIYL